MHAWIHIYIHTWIHIYMLAYMHEYIDTYMHTHTTKKIHELLSNIWVSQDWTMRIIHVDIHECRYIYMYIWQIISEGTFRRREKIMRACSYIVLQCVAVCCSVLQCVAVCCSVEYLEDARILCVHVHVFELYMNMRICSRGILEDTSILCMYMCINIRIIHDHTNLFKRNI